MQIRANLERGHPFSPTHTVEIQDRAHGGSPGVILSVRMKDGYEYTGELLSIRGDSLLIALGTDGFHSEYGIPPDISKHRLDHIEQITASGPTMTIPFAVSGLLLETCIGLYYHKWAEDHRPNWWWYHSVTAEWGSVIGGTVIGGIIGAFTHAGRERIMYYRGSDINLLHRYCRYQSVEPPYLARY
jgi:hypothetical protein